MAMASYRPRVAFVAGMAMMACRLVLRSAVAEASLDRVSLVLQLFLETFRELDDRVGKSRADDAGDRAILGVRHRRECAQHPEHHHLSGTSTHHRASLRMD